MLVAARLVEVSLLSGKAVFLAGAALLFALLGWALRAVLGHEMCRDCKPVAVPGSEVAHPAFTLVGALFVGAVLWHAVGEWRR